MATKFAGASQVVETRLTTILEHVEKIMKADCLTYDGSMIFGAEDWIRNAVEELAARPGKKRKLVFILETDGGYAEVVRRISDALRHHYKVVDFFDSQSCNVCRHNSRNVRRRHSHGLSFSPRAY